MATLLDKLLAKPIPAKKKGVEIKIPATKADIEAKPRVLIEEKIKTDFDRSALKLRLRQLRMGTPPTAPTPSTTPSVPASPMAPIVPPIAETEERGEEPEEEQEEEEEKAEEKEEKATPSVRVPRKMKVKKIKKGSIRIGNIHKGTITGITTLKVPSMKIKKGVRVRVKGKVSKTRMDVAPSMIKIGKQTIGERLGAPAPPIHIKASSYYMNNREIFINFITNLFEPYRRALLEESGKISCEKGSGPFTLLMHQEIVRDYMNLFTPYRGLLLYHGLGAGKTCASIAIAEAMKNHPRKSVLVMTPASLRQNYIHELKTCGDSLYRTNQFWEFVSTVGQPEREGVFSNVLSLPVDVVRKNGGVWFVNIREKPNYERLTAEQRMQVNAQIDIMIATKYQFLNYNGMNENQLQALIERGGGGNPFDDKIIIIDEAHNFVSRIVNKIKKPKSLSYRLYEFLLGAQRTRIVFLTGTPIINYPNEVAVLFNMLRGYIYTFILYVDVESTSRVDQRKIDEIFNNFKLQDYVQYNASAKTIVITRNPFGFLSKHAQGLYKGVALDESVTLGNYVDNRTFIRRIRQRLEKYNIFISREESKSYKALPDDLDQFNALFIDSKTGDVKNEHLFQRRILGLTSYFRSAQEQLMPAFDIEKDLIIENIPMSDYQFGIYEKAREGERDQELRNARKKKKSSGDDLYGDSVSTYRIFSRAFCNFVFPQEIGRPMPKEDQDIKAALRGSALEEDHMDIVSVDQQLANVDGRFDQGDAKALQELAKESKDASYDGRIRAALEALQAGGETYLAPQALQVYSPKFLSILENVTEKPGLHLIYSQFRTLEGIGILSLVLEQNGFARFRIKKNVAGQWELNVAGDKPTFALYTGTEDREEKEIMRNIYNSDWDNIPQHLAEQLRGRAANNNHGELIKIFMITSSGAEGITLRNTRFVHIMEPYWHPVRTEQVIGRARRICSHNDLPEGERNIKVFIYLMIFSDAQLVPAAAKGMASQALLQKDVSKIDKSTPLTSDQALFEISNIKEDINKQILRIIKSSAIDCALHARAGDKEKIVCMSFGKAPPGRFTTGPALTTEREYDRQRKMNLKKVTWKAEVVKIRGVRYALKRFNQKASARKAPEGELYDYDSYVRALRIGGDPVLMGYLRKDKATGRLKHVPE